MEVRYKREVNHNYMILEAPDEGGGYECRMLAANSIEGLLRFRVRQYEEKREFFYEITSKQPLKRLLEQRKISGGEIRSLMLGISIILAKIEEYLLKEEQILLQPEFIYIDPDRFQVFLCLLPGYSCNFPEALSELLRYLLEKINHRDREGVVMAYNLYHESLRENYGMADLLRHLSGAGDAIFSGGDDSLEEHTGIEEMREPIADEREKTGAQDDRMEDRLYNRGRGREEVPETAGVEDVKYSQKLQSGKRGKNMLQFFMLLLAFEGAIWYFTGKAGLYRYGVWLAAAAGLAAAVKLFFSGTGIGRVRGSEQKKEPAGGSENRAEEMETWRFRPESVEEYRQRKSEEERMEVLHAKENGTALLTQEDKNKFPYFESLSREEENIEITYVPFVIGKHPELADFCLQRPTVSRLHLRVDKREGVYIVTDLNSTNGTIVQGHKLQANETVSIQNGDVITVADVKYYFIETDES